MDTEMIVVLLIEDNHDDALLIHRYLSTAKKVLYQVHHVDELRKGLEYLNSGSVDVVLLDLGLPDAHGLSAFEKVHALSPNVPIIVLTGHDDDDLAMEAVHKGAQDYLVKGQIAGSLLQRSIRYAIERKKAAEELKRLNELLERQATTDPLTGILNRLKFNNTLNSEIQRSKRYAIPLSLIMFDIDHFKNINDSYGHHVGDRVLYEIVGLVKENIRVHDFFARWGGEEFMLLATNTEQDNARLLAENLRFMIGRHHIQGVGRVTCSFGVAQLINDTEDQLTQRVDRALYQAKANGRDRVEMA
ncbi:MAG TPA: diguanylate cyclase [Nitrospirota bacterium]|nr:diguanylate cyclase [Nitrospirota bacterium]